MYITSREEQKSIVGWIQPVDRMLGTRHILYTMVSIAFYTTDRSHDVFPGPAVALDGPSSVTKNLPNQFKYEHNKLDISDYIPDIRLDISDSQLRNTSQITVIHRDLITVSQRCRHKNV